MLSIEQAKGTDIAELANIELKAAALYPKGRIPQAYCEQTLPLSILRKAQQEKLLYCAYLNSNIVGFASCHKYSDTKNNITKHNLHLDEIAVLPKFGNQGIGSQLMEAILFQCQTLKFNGMSLTTFCDLPWNAPFYQKFGFNALKESNMPKHVLNIVMEEQFIGLKYRVAMFIGLHEINLQLKAPTGRIYNNTLD